MRYGLIFTALLLTACAGGNNLDYLRMHGINSATPENFTHCYNYGCQTKVTLELPDQTAAKLKKLFRDNSTSAAQERVKIAQAIQIFETDIGAITGTANDKHGTFRIYQDSAPKTRSFQQDCVDESTNTTTYLTLLSNMGLLKYNTPAFPTSRTPFTNKGRWWHQSAVMQDIETGERFAVDSWFEDNGNPAYIVPLAEWKDGWRPKKEES